MRPALGFADRVLVGTYWSAVGIFTATITALFLALFVNVFLRYAFDRGISWAYEIPAILFPWAVGSAVVIATVLGRNIQIELLVRILPSLGRRVAGILTHATVMAVSITILWTSWPTLKAAQFMKLAETGIPQFWGMLALVYLFGAMALVALIELVRLILGGPYLDEPSERRQFG